MAYSDTYDKRIDAGSSGGERTDLTPGRAYRVDIRRLPEEVMDTAYAAGTRGEGQERRVDKFLKSARSAGKFQKKRQYDAPYTDQTGQVPAYTEGNRFGRAGATNYADKPVEPTSMFGVFRGF